MSHVILKDQDGTVNYVVFKCNGTDLQTGVEFLTKTTVLGDTSAYGVLMPKFMGARDVMANSTGMVPSLVAVSTTALLETYLATNLVAVKAALDEGGDVIRG